MSGRVLIWVKCGRQRNSPPLFHVFGPIYVSPERKKERHQNGDENDSNDNGSDTKGGGWVVTDYAQDGDPHNRTLEQNEHYSGDSVCFVDFSGNFLAL